MNGHPFYTHLDEKSALTGEIKHVGTQLGRVVVNMGGTFTLKLYDGEPPPQPNGTLVAVIRNPKTGDTFPYFCMMDKVR